MFTEVQKGKNMTTRANLRRSLIAAAVVIILCLLAPASIHAASRADRILADAAKKGQTSIEMNGALKFDPDHISDEISEYAFDFMLDHPELFYLAPANRWVFWAYDGDITRINVTYTMKGAKKVRAQKKYNAALKKIVRKARKKRTKKEQIKSVNDSIRKMCRYDYKRCNLQASKAGNIRNAYGAIVEKKAVCQGYAMAFKAAMDQLGIKNRYKAGYENGEMVHIWNQVKLGRKWYHVDVTWNSTTRSNRYLLTKKHPA